MRGVVSILYFFGLVRRVAQKILSKKERNLDHKAHPLHHLFFLGGGGRMRKVHEMHNRTRAIGLHIIDAVTRSKKQSVLLPRNEMNKGDKALLLCVKV